MSFWHLLATLPSMLFEPKIWSFTLGPSPHVCGCAASSFSIPTIKSYINIIMMIIYIYTIYICTICIYIIIYIYIHYIYDIYIIYTIYIYMTGLKCFEVPDIGLSISQHLEGIQCVPDEQLIPSLAIRRVPLYLDFQRSSAIRWILIRFTTRIGHEWEVSGGHWGW